MWIRLSKLFYILLVMYYGWFQSVFFQIPNMLLILGAGMMGFIILHALQFRTNLSRSLTRELKIWMLFAFTSFATGLVVAVDYGYLIGSVITFAQFMVLIFGIVYISHQDRSINFFIWVFIGFAVLCAATTVFRGINYGNDRITMGFGNNPNSLGITMAIGVCCILYKLSLKKLFYSIPAFAAIIFLVYVIILTGSRKSFIGFLMILLFWLVFVALKDIKALRFTDKIKGTVSILLVIAAGYYILYPFLKDSVLLWRLTMLFQSGSETRESMYGEAIGLFKQNPLIGIGFNNYRALSIFGTYSHSTYAEVLACTGVVGAVIYFTPYIIITSKYARLVTGRKADPLLLKQARIMLGLFGVLLFLGTGIIHFYEMTSNIAFGMLIAFHAVNMSKRKTGLIKYGNC